MTGTTGQTQHTHLPRRRSTLRRWIAPIACLLIGMVLSIVSGWVCMFTSEGRSIVSWVDLETPVSFANDQPDSERTWAALGWKCTVVCSHPRREFERPTTLLYAEQIESGFPFLSAWAFSWTERSLFTELNLRVVGSGSAGIPFPRRNSLVFSSQRPSRIPIRPLFPGFALNTLIYAALTWCILFAPGHLRRRRRLARHQCPACAYPTGTTTTCTECGEPVTPHTPRATKS